jgi:hypothetical protein
MEPESREIPQGASLPDERLQARRRASDASRGPGRARFWFVRVGGSATLAVSPRLCKQRVCGSEYVAADGTELALWRSEAIRHTALRLDANEHGNPNRR